MNYLIHGYLCQMYLILDVSYLIQRFNILFSPFLITKKLLESVVCVDGCWLLKPKIWERRTEIEEEVVM